LVSISEFSISDKMNALKITNMFAHEKVTFDFYLNTDLSNDYITIEICTPLLSAIKM